MPRKLKILCEKWPLKKPFAISRGTKTEASVVLVEISCGDFVGRGECVPYPRYGEGVDSVVETIEKFSSKIEGGISRSELNKQMAPGAARNAIDIGLWDLEAKLSGKRAWELSGSLEPEPLVTAETISLNTVAEMAADAYRLRNAPLIKVKLDNRYIVERMQAIRNNAPLAEIIIDPNEGWSISDLSQVVPELQKLKVAMIEQPLPSSDDDDLLDFVCPIPLCADESSHTSLDLSNLLGKYQMINIKLDKTGGLTEALKLACEAKELGFRLMVGCMIGTSLAMAPALLLGSMADFVDLDGPLFLKDDRNFSLIFKGGKVFPPEPELWG